jgi:pimeloyl-ACP methyl ester carboxylesterase
MLYTYSLYVNSDIGDDRAMSTATVQLPEGPITYTETGAGPPLVFVHGFLVDGELWSEVTPLLSDRFRCIVPDLPLGSHRTAMNPDADLSPPGVAKIIAGFLEALDLEHVTLIGNDTGGAMCQLVATNHPERIGRLVLTPCDCYRDFLPPAFRYLQVVARIPGALTILMQSMRPRPMRRMPIAFGWLTKKRLPDELLDRWVQPAMTDRAVRRDAGKLLRGISNRYTLEAAERLADFDRPTLIAWAPEDRFFKVDNGRKLAATIPDCRLELIDDSRTFVSLDQPAELARLVGDFAAQAG